MPERTRFYATALPDHRCEHNRCGAKASQEVRGPFNARYGYVCTKHLEARLADLERAHAATPVAEMPRT